MMKIGDDREGTLNAALCSPEKQLSVQLPSYMSRHTKNNPR